MYKPVRLLCIFSFFAEKRAGAHSKPFCEAINFVERERAKLTMLQPLQSPAVDSAMLR